MFCDYAQTASHDFFIVTVQEPVPESFLLQPASHKLYPTSSGCSFWRLENWAGGGSRTGAGGGSRTGAGGGSRTGAGGGSRTGAGGGSRAGAGGGSVSGVDCSSTLAGCGPALSSQ